MLRARTQVLRAQPIGVVMPLIRERHHGATPFEEIAMILWVGVSAAAVHPPLILAAPVPVAPRVVGVDEESTTGPVAEPLPGSPGEQALC